MNLARMMTDKFFIEDRNGMRSGPFKTKFGGTTLMVFHDALQTAEGDRIIRLMPDGSEQVCVVESSAFSAGSRHIPGHFSIGISEPLPVSIAALSTTPAPHPVASSMQALAQAIERTAFPPQQKREAQAMLQALLAHPVVAAALAG